MLGSFESERLNVLPLNLIAQISGSRPVIRQPPVVRSHLRSGLRAKATFNFFKDTNAQTDEFWQFSMDKFSEVFHNKEKKCCT